MRPSIMSLGQTTSAPASTCDTAVRTSSSTRRVVHDVAVGVDDAAMPVRRVLAEAHVGHQHELGEARPQRAQRALDDAVVDPRARAFLVLLLRQPEEDHRRDAEANELLDLADDAVDRVAAESGQALVRERLGRDEERHHEVVDRQRRLAREVAQRARPPQAPQACRGKAHGRNGRTALRASSEKSAPSPTSQAVSRATAPHGCRS